MSYRIDFRISCPQCFSYEQEPYHASIVILQSPDSPEPFFSYPGGCGGRSNIPQDVGKENQDSIEAGYSERG